MTLFIHLWISFQMSCEYAYIFNRTTKTCSGIVIDHTKINRPYPRPRPQINSSLRRFDWRKKQFPVHHGEHHLVHHVETVGFAVVVGQEVSFIQFISILPVENKKKTQKRTHSHHNTHGIVGHSRVGSWGPKMWEKPYRTICCLVCLSARAPIQEKERMGWGESWLTVLRHS